MAGYIVKAVGFDAGFLTLAAIAAAATLFHALAMPETGTSIPRATVFGGPRARASDQLRSCWKSLRVSYGFDTETREVFKPDFRSACSMQVRTYVYSRCCSNMHWGFVVIPRMRRSRLKMSVISCP